MTNNFDYYDEKILSEKLNKIGYDLKYKEVMRSTLDFSLKKKFKQSLLILVDHQTNGRGRYKNCWNDEKNKSMLATIVEKNSSIDKLPVQLLSHLLALQICLALKKLFPSQEIKIKWPNDIMLSGKKIAGILLEKKEDVTLLGFGINIYKNNIPDGAYLMKKKVKFGRQNILLGIMNGWHKLKKELENDSFKKKMPLHNALWEDASFILNKKIFMSLKNRVIIGVVKESLLGEDIIVESDNKSLCISENDYTPGSLVIT